MTNDDGVADVIVARVLAELSELFRSQTPGQSVAGTSPDGSDRYEDSIEQTLFDLGNRLMRRSEELKKQADRAAAIREDRATGEDSSNRRTKS